LLLALDRKLLALCAPMRTGVRALRFTLNGDLARSWSNSEPSCVYATVCVPSLCDAVTLASYQRFSAGHSMLTVLPTSSALVTLLMLQLLALGCAGVVHHARGGAA